MSAFRSLATRRSPFVSYQITQRAAFHQSLARTAGKESSLHQEGRSEQIESEKQDMLKKQKEKKDHWHDGLASDSESIIKADRGEIEATDDMIKKLQDETKKVGQK